MLFTQREAKGAWLLSVWAGLLQLSQVCIHRLRTRTQDTCQYPDRVPRSQAWQIFKEEYNHYSSYLTTFDIVDLHTALLRYLVQQLDKAEQSWTPAARSKQTPEGWGGLPRDPGDQAALAATLNTNKKVLTKLCCRLLYPTSQCLQILLHPAWSISFLVALIYLKKLIIPVFTLIKLGFFFFPFLILSFESLPIFFGRLLLEDLGRSR